MAIEATNGRYLKAVEAFESADGPEKDRDRVGDCPECGGANTVKGIERRKGRFVVVEGACTDCDFEFSRAGYGAEDEPVEEEA